VTRTWTATDACGNTSTASQTISFTRDTTAPAITCPPSQVFCIVPGNFYNIPLLVASDNCSGSLAVNFTVTGATSATGNGYDASGFYDVGVSQITWTVVDACGNVSTCNTSITVNPLVTTTSNVSV